MQLFFISALLGYNIICMVMDLLNAGAHKLDIQLNKEQTEKFELYYRELFHWNQRINISGISDYADVQIKHFLDSLTIIVVWQPGKESVMDVGPGAGLPSLPLKILFPDIRLTLLEATQKKVEFLRYIVPRLALDNVEIIHNRAEELAHVTGYRENYDVVLARAVAELPTLVELTLPFCRPGGIFISSKKGEIAAELADAENAIAILGGKFKEVRNIDLPEFSDERRLVVIEKVAITPAKYPRRPGMPEKRPIK